MEEAEALSNKMGIMVKGGIFKCFGSAQHIKDKFGKAYEIEIKTRPIVDEEIEAWAREHSLGEKVDLNHGVELLEKKENVQSFVLEEIKPHGLGSELYNEGKTHNGQVAVRNLFTWKEV